MSLILSSVCAIFGRFGEFAVLFSVSVFGYSTIICWYFYGLESFISLFNRRYSIVFLPIFLCSVFLGTIADNAYLVLITDYLMLVLCIFTLGAIIKNSDRIKFLSEKGGVLSSHRPRIKGNVFSKGEKRK